MPTHAETYQPCSCGGGCDYATDGNPCWGWCSGTWEDDDGWMLHACIGHTDMAVFKGGVYRPMPPNWDPEKEIQKLYGDIWRGYRDTPDAGPRGKGA